MITLRVKGLSKRYRVRKGAIDVPSLLPHRWEERRARKQQAPPPKEVWALRDVSFKTAEGQILGVIGPNGAGKSTLLKVLARISPPTIGQVEVHGRVVPLLEIGAAFQPDATGRENVYLNAALYGIPRAVVNRRLDDIVEFAGVEKFLDTQVKRYSSGMYLRLAFSVAVNMEPDVLLADEVLAVGDLAFQERCLRRVEEAGRNGLTVIFVSHDMAAIRRLCNRAMWINDGRIVEAGKPDDVVSAYEESTWAMIAGNEHGGSHANDHGEIVHTRLLAADGSEVGSARVTDELIVRVTLRVDRAGVGFRCILMFAADGVDAFRSVQPMVVSAAEPGLYCADVRIPANLLSDNVYSVKTGVWFSIDGREHRDHALVRHNSLTFRVYDGEEGTDSARGSYTGPLKGLIRPRLDWDVETYGTESVKRTRAVNGRRASGAAGSRAG